MADRTLYFQELISGARRRKRDRLLLALLRLLSRPYALLLQLRAWGYRVGVLPSNKLSVPVISVGNVALGGTGKTPMVARIAEVLIGRGLKVAVLSRGYGGSAKGELRIVSDGEKILVDPEESGDEPYLLAQKVPGLMVVIGANRYEAGLLALRELKPDLFILDDGFQHLRLQRDLNILLLDAAKPFANGHTLPAGFLREKPSACRRADLVVYTRSQCAGEPDLFPDKPSCWANHRITALRPLQGGERSSLELLKGARVTAFSGIAHPNSFFDLLEREGVPLIAALSFADHVDYGEEEIAALCRLKDASRSQFLVTTEKDAVKLTPFLHKLGECHVALLELEFHNSDPLDAALEKFLY